MILVWIDFFFRQYWFKNLFVFNFIRDYFHLRLVKTAELPSGRPYILAIFPHGVVPYGAVINFSTNANNYRELFPGLDIRGALMPVLYFIPIMREISIALGEIFSFTINFSSWRPSLASRRRAYIDDKTLWYA